MRRRGKWLALSLSVALGSGGPSVLAQQLQQELNTLPRPRNEDNRVFMPDAAPSLMNPKNTRNNGVRSAQFYCLDRAVTAFDSYRGNAVAKPFAQAAFFMSCVVKAMPADWPDRNVILQHASDLAVRARQADPAVDSCLLSACAVGPGKPSGNFEIRGNR
ncbi:MAG TPA: hypothetical protein VMI56_14425 [Reyranella sp.]|nr:hypothetical protein [Reyranella sp.]